MKRAQGHPARQLSHPFLANDPDCPWAFFLQAET